MSKSYEQIVRETLEVEFQPHNFFPCEPADLPFTEEIGTRGWLVTFRSHFTGQTSFDRGLKPDLELLAEMELETCWYGATDGPILPFLCEFGDLRRPLSGSDVLAGLNARHFRSEHIPNLGATRIAYPGYRPYSDNDEIHNDFAEQYLFEHEEASEFDGAHGKLKQYVMNNQLWYVLLHLTKHDRITEFVFLFAVGLAPARNRLIGVATYQVCHNLCD